MAQKPGVQLIRYDAMCRAIASAYEVDEVKSIRDTARAVEVYARQAKNTEAERQACEIRLRAERKCGQLLRQMRQDGRLAKGGRPYHKNSSSAARAPSGETSLRDLKLSESQSFAWQKLAESTDKQFDKTLSTIERPTTAGLIAAHTAPKQNQMDDRALWLWGRLQDFERNHLLSADPNDLFSQMFDHMKETTRRLLPLVIAWLGRIK